MSTRAARAPPAIAGLRGPEPSPRDAALEWRARPRGSRPDPRSASLATPRRLVTRFQKLAAATVVTAILLVTIGVIVRATGSGLGCPDWPLCHGQLIPAIDDYKAWLEWIHRGVAVVIGFEVL